MTSPARQAGNSVVPCSPASSQAVRGGFPSVHAAPEFTVLSLELVATPEKAGIALAALPVSIRAAFAGIPGFAGCQVMVSDQEPRLITVLVLWSGSEARQRCAQSARRVRALLAPYLDHCLRVQTLAAHQPLPNALQPETTGADTGFMMEDAPGQEPGQIREEGVCVA